MLRSSSANTRPAGSRAPTAGVRATSDTRRHWSPSWRRPRFDTRKVPMTSKQPAEHAAVDIDPPGGKTATEPRSVRDAVLDVMRRYEMTTIFGNPGSTEISFLVGFPDDMEFR